MHIVHNLSEKVITEPGNSSLETASLERTSLERWYREFSKWTFLQWFC
jgi:hypothetical protein